MTSRAVGYMSYPYIAQAFGKWHMSCNGNKWHGSIIWDSFIETHCLEPNTDSSNVVRSAVA